MATLPAASPSQGIYVATALSGSGVVQNVWSDAQTGRIVTFSENQTPFTANASCPAGSTAGVNNTCILPRSASAAPYRHATSSVSAMFSQVFAPLSGSPVPPASATTAYLQAQRGRPGPGAYQPMF